MSYASERARAFDYAERMIGFNARPGTVCAITGLSQKEIHENDLFWVPFKQPLIPHHLFGLRRKQFA